jgi:large subunit ribosomal protein L22
VTGVKTNERPGTRAVLRHYRMSASKVRQVLDLIRGEDITTAHEILSSTTREGARVVDKVLHSAVSNAVESSRQAGAAIDPEELYVSACFADEGTTLKRWRPRARGRATRIRKRTSHITVIVSRLDDERIARLRVKRTEATAALRSRRVAASRLRRRGGEEAGEETGNRASRRRGGDADKADASDKAGETVEDMQPETGDTTTGDTTTGDTATGDTATGDVGDAEATDELGAGDSDADAEAEGDVEAEADAGAQDPGTGDTDSGDTDADETVDTDGNGETD